MYSKGLLSIAVLLLMIFVSTVDSSAQIQHRQLREEMLESRTEKAPEKPVVRRRPPVKPATVPPPVAPIRSPYDQQNARIIVMENADLLQFDQMLRQIGRAHV